MIFRRSTLSILLMALGLGLTAHASATSSDDSCEKSLGSELQEQIRVKESEVYARIEKLEARLGAFSNPFVFAFNEAQMDPIFDALLRRERDGREVQSPMALVNTKLKRTYLKDQPISWKLVNYVQADSDRLLDDEMAARKDLQSDLVALKFTLDYLRRFKEPEAIVDLEGKTEEEKDEEPKKEEKKKKDKKQDEEDDSPPTYPKLPREYKPQTNDINNESGKKQKPYVVVEMNLRSPYFGLYRFADVQRYAQHPFREGVSPVTPTRPGKFESTKKTMKVYNYGETSVDLFLPPGYKPKQSADARANITRSEAGGYVLNLPPGAKETVIPLVEDSGILLTPMERERFTRAVGFADKEWPAEIQAAILHRFSKEDAKTNPLKVASAIREFIAHNYLYSFKAQSATDPIDALEPQADGRPGAFQCDMAAFAMVGLLRDAYGIPSVAVGGFRGSARRGAGEDKSFLAIPSEGHAWVEVFAEGRWHAFDPTPLKKDSEDKREKGESEFSPINDDDDDLPPPPDLDDTPDTAEATPAKKSHAEQVKEDSDKTVKAAKPSEDAPDEEMSKDELVDLLTVGSLTMKPEAGRNPLLDRANRLLLRYTLEPTQTGLDMQNRLHQIKNLIRFVPSPELKALYAEAMATQTKDHPDLARWIERLMVGMGKQTVNRSYQELFRIRSTIEQYARLLDRPDKVQYPGELMATLNSVSRELDKLSHPNSGDIALVNDLVRDLPTVTRILIKNKYDLVSVGPNAPTLNLAQQLRAGNLNDIRLLSILNPLSNFILNSTPRPEYIQVRTWERDHKRNLGRDLLPLQRFSEIPRAMLAEPGRGLMANLRRGTAYVPQHRRRVNIPAGHGDEEAERVTIVLYDTSGSMSGDPARFQAALISAFTATALSDVSPSGRHRHRVMIVPFDSEVGAPTVVTNVAEALAVIENYKDTLKNTNGGTDIQKAMLEALAIIAEAEERSGEPLSAANIVLMTDGQAVVNLPELYAARQAIDRRTPLQAMFIAINDTNSDLMEFAMKSQEMGVDRGFYREYTRDLITEILAEADHLKIPKDAFYSEAEGTEIPKSVIFEMDKAFRLAQVMTKQILADQRYMSPTEHLEELEKLRWSSIAEIDRPLESWLVRLRRHVLKPAFQKDRRLLERVANDIVKNFETLGGILYNDLSGHEQEHLRHFLRYAAGIETGLEEGSKK